MVELSMKELLEAGVHFGHLTKKWHPKMKRYIYGARNGIYIIDLNQTIKLFQDALEYVGKIAEDGGNILFVGTKKQAQSAMKEAAQKCGMYFVTDRWLGGMLTNWKTMQQRINRLNELDKMEEDGYIDRLPKKEQLKRREERSKLNRYLEGIRYMPGMPACLFVVDVNKELIAIKEAKKLGIPVVGVVDTNSDPDLVDVIIPGNDDAIRSIKLVASKVSEAVIAARPVDAEAADGSAEGEAGSEDESGVVFGAVEAELLKAFNVDGSTESNGAASKDVAPEKVAAEKELAAKSSEEK